jgi:phage tail sheath protein FI
MGTLFANLPGVKIQEVALGAPPIVGVGTSTAGFVGKAPNAKLAIDTAAVQITSYDQFLLTYVNPVDSSGNLTNPPLVTRSTSLSRAVRGFFSNGGTECYVVNVKDEADDAAGAATITAVEAGIDLLGLRDDIEIIAAPGSYNKQIADYLTKQAKSLTDRVAILDPPPKTVPTDLEAGGGKRPGDTEWSALYYPRIVVGPDLSDKVTPANGDPVTEAVTPVGHIAGVYALTDANRGVHKAPANVTISGALSTEVLLIDSDNDPLNKDGVNALRVFNGNVVVWGARTLQAGGNSIDILFRYINIRRLTIYIEQSLKQGLRFAVFEPNNLALRQTITRSVKGFLDGVWRDGALFGATPDEAYYVRFPDPFNTDADRLAGKLVVEIGLRPAPPAEFIIIRIGILTQSAAAS